MRTGKARGTWRISTTVNNYHAPFFTQGRTNSTSGPPGMPWRISSTARTSTPTRPWSRTSKRAELPRECPEGDGRDRSGHATARRSRGHEGHIRTPGTLFVVVGRTRPAGAGVSESGLRASAKRDFDVEERLGKTPAYFDPLSASRSASLQVTRTLSAMAWLIETA